MKTSTRCKSFIAALFLCAALIPSIAKADVSLIENGKSRVAIHVAPEVMADDKKLPGGAPFLEVEAETQRRRLRESVNDLALYLQKMSGAQVGVLLRTANKDDKLTPIFIGQYATQKFGETQKKTPFKQGFRIAVSKAGIGLLGETDEATSYAIYTLLDKLGCRWFLPGEMGESILQNKTLRLPESDVSDAPDTYYRGIWYGDDAFKRRNRLGGFKVSAGHALEGYISVKQREEHPEWRATIDGKPHPRRLKWSNPAVSDAVADTIIAMLDKNYTPSVSLSPDDGAEFDQTDDTKLDAGDWDASMNQVSITDRYVNFCNRIAERVTKKYPDVRFGFLAYVQYTRPPVREKLHPNLIPEIAPITYCRAHAMTDANCPSRPQIKPIVEGWGKVAPGRVSYYNYMFHLAEVSVPYPMMHQMSEELPILYSHGVAFWQPETMPNFESILPGMWLTIRKSWDTKANSDTVLNEFFTRFYGGAQAPMRRYWKTFDDAWTDVDEHAGSGWGYMRRFTPDVMKNAREAMDDALHAANTPMEYRRVKMQDESLRQFERFIELRHNLSEGRLAKLDLDSTKWMGTQLGLGDEYAPESAFSKVAWTPNTIGGAYFKSFLKRLISTPRASIRSTLSWGNLCANGNMRSRKSRTVRRWAGKNPISPTPPGKPPTPPSKLGTIWACPIITAWSGIGKA